MIARRKIYRYADCNLDKGFKIVLGRPGSEEVFKHLLNRLLGLCIARLEYRNTEHPGMTEDETGACFQVEMQNWTPLNSSLRTNEFISTYRYLDIETNEELGNGTNLVFIDLHGFKKDIEDCKSLEDIWMYRIKNMFAMGECPEIIKGTEIEELYALSEFANMTLDQRLKIEESIMTQNDILNSIAEQIQDAREEAIAIGRQRI